MLDLSGSSIGNIDYFAFDNDSLNSKSNSFNNDDFFKFYSTIPTDITTDVNVHIEKVKQYYKDNNIIFNNNEVSLISMYFHDVIEESYLFVGHTGILLEDSNDLYFIEKVSFQEPIRLLNLVIEASLENI